MSEAQTPQPQSPPTPKPHKHIAEQDQREANEINEISERIKVAQADAEITALMAPKGYDDARYTQGLALVTTAGDTRSGRQMAIGAGESATTLLQTSRKDEHAVYVDFREDVRAEFPSNDAAQTALGVKGKVPDDSEKFIAAARVSYAAAKLAPYATVLTGVGYDTATLDAHLANLEVLASQISGRSAAKGSGEKATSDREAAMTALRAWDSRFRRIAKRQMRTRPDLLLKLKIKH